MSEHLTPAQTAQAPQSDVAAWLIDRIRFYDQVDAAEVTLEAPVAELGLDSIYVMTLCGDIEDTYDIAIDPTFFAEFGTLGEVADALTARVAAA
ncbi:acyl carrier protein [Microbacterium sp. zg.B48]|uniref:acyl carrier protein n=1 Tax=unclassified Microbacterium TaxID=2609290 RepID=UPI00214B5E40|nr:MULTISPECIES: acyl carrier protein [unclassified Microbacterium]MCR2763287.1 acyl carrier protein [Microbacterium sp. zg.B48]MCR2808876.1 acyl carrier protein [Microbacterium sp. zg.B185]WIM18706.1 acyl carrier protein [Microbacterium sp. zg-B185]